MPHNLIGCEPDARTIHIHAGYTPTVLDSFAIAYWGAEGLTVANGNLIVVKSDIPATIYIYDGITSTVIDSFPTLALNCSGIAFTGTNLISSDPGQDRIYVHSGLTSVIIDSFVAPAQAPYGLAFNGANLISSDFGMKQIYIHDGISSTITDWFDSPDQTDRPLDLAFDGANLISTGLYAGGRIYIHDGITEVVTDRVNPPYAISGITVEPNQAPTAPTGLLTQGETNPTTLETLTPYFSAIFNDPDSGDIGQNYEIEVNTASDFSGTSMWDTGKTSMADLIEGNRCPNVTYAGTPLVEGTTYYWRIRFWDDDDAQGAWSATANFRAFYTPTAPTDLRVSQCPEEFNPIEIKEGKPRFSAIFNDPTSGDIADNYQVQVNTNSSFTGTEMWNSGKTSMDNLNEGERCDEIIYQGAEISEGGTVYYWRMKFWDDEGHEGDWPDPGIFTMTGLKRRDSLLSHIRDSSLGTIRDPSVPITINTRSLTQEREIILPSDN